MDPVAFAELVEFCLPILAASIGLVGVGVVPRYIVNSNSGPLERFFASQKFIFCLLFCGFDIARSLLIPPWYNMLFVVPYLVVLLILIRSINEMPLRTQALEPEPDL